MHFKSVDSYWIKYKKVNKKPIKKSIIIIKLYIVINDISMYTLSPLVLI